MNFLSNYGATLTTLALVSGAIVFLYSNGKKDKRSYLREENIDVTRANGLLVQKVESLESEVKTLAATVANLREVATQTPEVKQLLKTSAAQIVLTAQQHSEVIVQLTGLTKEMAKLTREFSHVAQAIAKNSAAQTINSAAQKANTKSRESL